MSDLFIQTRGRGDVHLVLVHGWAMHGDVFAPLFAALGARCTLHAVDLPGHGRSRGSVLPLEPSACARAIADATPPAIWLGWSMGGLVSLAGALERPDAVRGLAMLSSTPRFVRAPDWPYGMEPEVFGQFAHDLEHDFRGTLDRFLALEAMGSEHAREEIRRLRTAVFANGEPDPRVLGQGLALLDQADLRARLPQVAQPNAWIAGRRDRLVPAAAMAWAAEQCEGRYTCIPRAGHAAFLGFADAVVEALEPLIAEASA